METVAPLSVDAVMDSSRNSACSTLMSQSPWIRRPRKYFDLHHFTNVAVSFRQGDNIDWHLFNEVKRMYGYCTYQSVFWSSMTNKVKQRSLLYGNLPLSIVCCCCCCIWAEATRLTLPTTLDVKLETLWSKDSRDFAGDVGALVVRLLGLNGNERSGCWGTTAACPTLNNKKIKIVYFCCTYRRPINFNVFIDWFKYFLVANFFVVRQHHLVRTTKRRERSSRYIETRCNVFTNLSRSKTVNDG